MASLQSSVLFLVLVAVGIQALPAPNGDSVVEIMRMLTHTKPVVSYSVGQDKNDRSGEYKLSFGPYQQAFEDFKKDNGVYYGSDAEEAYRFSVFKDNVQLMEKHNLEYHQGRRSFYQDVNQFTDKTLEEYRVHNRLGRYSHSRRLVSQSGNGVSWFSMCGQFKPEDADSDPKGIDWRMTGKVTNVKDQKQCGSCWTFSTTGAIEGSFAIRTGRLVSLSEQQIVDCCHDRGCSGCNGGIMDTAFSFVNQTGGLESESDYGYMARDGACKFHSSQVKVHVTGCADVESGDEEALRNAVAKHGPVAVAIDANHEAFQGYSGGVYFNEACSPTQLDHGVLVVGYGTQDGLDYWIVKNSWGPKWGLKGYILMARNRGNNCGIASMSSFPFTAKP